MGVEPVALAPSRLSPLGKELAAILARATALGPADRYGGIAALADELRRWCERRPVQAVGGGWLYRSGCLLRRHPLVTTAAVAGTVALVILGWRVVVERDAARAEALRAQQQAQRAEAALDFMGQLLRWARPSAQQGRDIPVSEVLSEGSKRLQTWNELPPRLRGELALLLGEIQMQRRAWAISLTLLESAYRLLREDPQTDTGALLRSASRLGTALAGAQDRARSLALLDEVLSLGVNLPQARADYFNAAKTKAVRLRQAGRLTDAVATLDDALAQPVLRPEAETEPRAALAMDRAILVFELGGPDDRLATTRASLDAADRVFGPEHPETTNKVLSYTQLLVAAGEYEQAQPFLERGISARRRVWGENHVEFARALGVQAELDWRRGRLDSAQAAIDRAVSICEADPQSGHRFLSKLLELSGKIAVARGDLAGAERRYRRALEPELAAATMSPLDDLRLSYARLLRRTAKFDEAERMLEAVEQNSNQLEASHPRRALLAVERSYFIADRERARQSLVEAGFALEAARDSRDKRSARQTINERLGEL
jgi:serine/threonine-protein kinase